MQRLLGWVKVAGRWGWHLGGIAVGVLVLWVLFQKLLLLVVTLFLALLTVALFGPVADALERRGVPRAGAALVSLLFGTALVVGLVALVAFQIADQAPMLVDEYTHVRERLMGWLTRPPLDLSEAQVDAAVQRAVNEVRGNWSAMAGRAFLVLEVVGALITALVMAFFLIRDTRTIRDWVLTRLVADDQEALVVASARRALGTLQDYVRASVIIGGIDAVLIGVALAALDVPLAVPLAVLTFFLGFIPGIGAIIAGALATLVAVVSSGPVQGLVVVAIILVIQQFDGNVLQPVVMGQAVNLHPVVILAALMAGALLAGIVGVLMAVPTAAVLTAVVDERRQWERGRTDGGTADVEHTGSR